MLSTKRVLAAGAMLATGLGTIAMTAGSADAATVTAKVPVSVSTPIPHPGHHGDWGHGHDHGWRGDKGWRDHARRPRKS